MYSFMTVRTAEKAWPAHCRTFELTLFTTFLPFMQVLLNFVKFITHLHACQENKKSVYLVFVVRSFLPKFYFPFLYISQYCFCKTLEIVSYCLLYELAIASFCQVKNSYEGRNIKDCSDDISTDETDVFKNLSSGSQNITMKNATKEQPQNPNQCFSGCAHSWINTNKTNWTIPGKFWKLRRSWILYRGWLCCPFPEFQKFPLSIWWCPGQCL